MLCKNKRDKHSLCKLDIWCALLKMEEQEKTIGIQQQDIEELDKKLGDMTVCSDITFIHNFWKFRRMSC